MIDVVAKPLDLAKRHDIPLRCGEFGVIEFLSPDIGERWLRDTFSVFNELNIGWSYWCYEKGDDVFGILNTDGSERWVMNVIREQLIND